VSQYNDQIASEREDYFNSIDLSVVWGLFEGFPKSNQNRSKSLIILYTERDIAISEEEVISRRRSNANAVPPSVFDLTGEKKDIAI